MEEKKATIQRISVDADILYRRLAETSPGDVVTYDELSAEIGRDVQSEARGLLNTARNKALREDRAVFGVRRGVGLERLGDVGVVETATESRGRIRRMSRRAARRLSCVDDFDNLPQEKKTEHNVAVSMFGAIYVATSKKGTKRLTGAVESANAELSLAKTLEAWRSS